VHPRLPRCVFLVLLLLSQAAQADCQWAGAAGDEPPPDIVSGHCQTDAETDLDTTDGRSPATSCCGDCDCGCVHMPALTVLPARIQAASASPHVGPVSFLHSRGQPFRLFRPPA
jgi:hypothetical protein